MCFYLGETEFLISAGEPIGERRSRSRRFRRSKPAKKEGTSFEHFEGSVRTTEGRAERLPAATKLAVLGKWPAMAISARDSGKDSEKKSRENHCNA